MLITNVEYALFAARSNNNQISRQIKKAGVHVHTRCLDTDCCISQVCVSRRRLLHRIRGERDRTER